MTTLFIITITLQIFVLTLACCW